MKRTQPPQIAGTLIEATTGSRLRIFICPEEIPSQNPLSLFLQREQASTLVGYSGTGSPTGRPQLAWHTNGWTMVRIPVGYAL